MDMRKSILRIEHPPHKSSNRGAGRLKRPGWVKIETIPEAVVYKRKSLSLHSICLKFVLFAVVFILSFNLPFPPGIKYLPHGLGFLSLEHQKREYAIQEILGVLERYPTGLANVTKEELAEVIYEEANRRNQDPKFILALIAVESEFYNWAVSEKGAKGLMQIMPYVAQPLAHELGIEWSGDRTLFNPYLNIRIGIYYLSQLILDFKDTEAALTAYNYGPTYVKSLLERKERIPHDYYRRFLSVYQTI
ncbi:MAG: lytic transglycosylase domain-containing protein [bacterium]